MWGEMGFSSIPMGKSLGVEVKPPFLDPLFMDYAKKLPNNLKINEENGVKYSKWVLRKAYEDLIPKDVIWRPKAPLEQGTGTTVLTDYFDKEISDKDFAEKKNRYLRMMMLSLQVKNNCSTTNFSGNTSQNHQAFTVIK